MTELLTQRACDQCTPLHLLAPIRPPAPRSNHDREISNSEDRRGGRKCRAGDRCGRWVPGSRMFVRSYRHVGARLLVCVSWSPRRTCARASPACTVRFGASRHQGVLQQFRHPLFGRDESGHSLGISAFSRDLADKSAAPIVCSASLSVTPPRNIAIGRAAEATTRRGWLYRLTAPTSLSTK